MIAGVTAATAAKLAQLGIRTQADLVLHLPLRYEDETRIVTLREARDGQLAQIEGTVTNSEVTQRPRRQPHR